MKYLNEYIKEFSPYPDQIILKRFKHGIYYQGKVTNIPEKYRQYYVLEHTSLRKSSRIEFMLVEGI